MIELDFVAHMVLGRKLVDVARRLRIRYNKSRLREGVRCPDISERATAAIRNPEARILRIPALAQVGVGRVVVVVGVRPPALAAEKTHVVHERVFAGLPPQSHRTRIDAPRKDTDAAHKVRSALWCKKDGFGRAHPLITGS